MTEDVEARDPIPTVRVIGTNGLAIAALVLGIVWLGGLGSLLAVVFGLVALAQIKRTGEAGTGMAVAGLALGVVGVLVVGGLFAAVVLLGSEPSTDGQDDSSPETVADREVCEWTTTVPSSLPTDGYRDTVAVSVDGLVLSTRYQRAEAYGVHVSLVTDEAVSDLDAATTLLNEPTDDGRFETTFEMIDTSPEGPSIEIPCEATVELEASVI